MKPNILFFVIDSFRADKCYGNTKTSKTPNIDFLINNGIYCSQAISSVASTGVSLGSMFTALYPFKTGMSSESYRKLNSKATNYVSILTNNGYNAYATTPEIASALGLTCDFQNNDTAYENYFGLFAGLGRQILDRLESKKIIEPWIFYIHLLDLHQPVIVPKEFDDEKFGSSQYERMVSAIDVWLGRILQQININNTLIVLTADHGEYLPIINRKGKSISYEPSSVEKTLWKIGNRIPSFLRPIKSKTSSALHNIRNEIKSAKLENLELTPYEKRILLYSRMSIGHHVYDDVIHIPLIFSGYGFPSKLIISQQVRNIDIFPTIAEIVEIPSKDENIHGRSLVPLFHGKKLEELPAYIESMPNIEKSQDKLIGIRTSEYKYVRSIKDPEKIELYDLKNDPLEENNIAENKKNIVIKMEKILTELREDSLPESEQEEMTETETKKVEQELKKLGYI
jgi:arylsulfatase A-like enzyme